jgi:hypothetical protein
MVPPPAATGLAAISTTVRALAGSSGRPFSSGCASASASAVT